MVLGTFITWEIFSRIHTDANEVEELSGNDVDRLKEAFLVGSVQNSFLNNPTHQEIVHFQGGGLY